MKKLRLFVATIVMTLAVLFGGNLQFVNAEGLPETVTSNEIKVVNFINTKTSKGEDKTWPIIVKTATDSNGKVHYVYCMNLDSTYKGGINFTKTGEVEAGYRYILNKVPNTGNADKNFYITQMAVWMLGDHISGTNYNLDADVKQWIVKHADSSYATTEPENHEIAKAINDLYEGAIKYHDNYKEVVGKIEIDRSNVTFTEKDGYYVSSEIKINYSNIDSELSYSLTNTPKGSTIVKGSNGGIIVKIPSSEIPANQTLTFQLNVSGDFKVRSAYYYYHSKAYQKMLFGEQVITTKVIKDSVTMKIAKKDTTPGKTTINISKTDVTQEKEVPGATLVVKDKDGKVIESWVSTTESHKITLEAGEYSLTETLAPDGYKLSSTTIYFMLDENGNLFAKNENGVYVSVDKVSMINELKDVVSFVKKDTTTDKRLAGATLVIKDSKGNVVKEFTTTDGVYSLTLDAGVYTLSEKAAPSGYVLSNEVITFKLLEDGTLKVMNNKGEYADSALITYYNTPEGTPTTPEKPNTPNRVVNVPSTGASANLIMFGGIALLIGGIAYAKKSIKEC